MAVLYRKYRPQTFAEVLNQKPIIQTLKNQVKSGQLAHAYLFTGSRGVGKTSVARILAKAVNCLNPSEGEPDGECEICKAIAQNGFLDLVEIDAASNTGVDNIRELIEHVKFSPSLGKYKVFIIDEVHMLSKGAFNALLKTLEEPPAHAIFVLATTEINKVPATIISRTQRFDFKALSVPDIFEHLEKISAQENIKFDKAILELVAQNAEGSVRDALSLLDKITTLGSNPNLADCQQLLGITDIAVCENLLELIVSGNGQAIPEFYNQLTEQGLDYAILNRDFLEFLRKVLIQKVTAGAQDFGLQPEHLERIFKLSQALSAPEIILIIRLFLKAYKDSASSPDPQIPILLASLEAALRKNSLSVAPVAVAKAVPAQNSKTAEQENYSAPPPRLESIIQTPENVPQVITLSELEIIWPQAIIKVKKINGPLASLLKNCQLLLITGNRLTLGVKFLFDKQSLDSHKNSALILEALEELSGIKMALAAEVVKSEIAMSKNPSEIITDALKVFGGELID